MGSSRQTILAVDDFPAVTEMLAALLSQYDVHRAPTATEALGMARTRGYDLYVLDFALPDMSGPAFCHAVRELDPNVPIVVYSGWSEPAAGAGWTVWLEKGGEVDVLARRIDELLQSQRLLNESAEQAELTAVADELARRDAEHEARVAAVSMRLSESAERIRAAWARHCGREDLRKVFDVYQKAGGTRSSFAEYWADLVDERGTLAAAARAPEGR